MGPEVHVSAALLLRSPKASVSSTILPRSPTTPPSPEVGAPRHLTGRATAVGEMPLDSEIGVVLRRDTVLKNVNAGRPKSRGRRPPSRNRTPRSSTASVVAESGQRGSDCKVKESPYGEVRTFNSRGRTQQQKSHNHSVDEDLAIMVLDGAASVPVHLNSDTDSDIDI